MRARYTIAAGLTGLLILAVGAAPASAQTTGARVPVTFDVVGGVNISSLSFPVVPPELTELGFEFSAGHRSGLVAGALVGVPARDGIMFETGALISFRGASLRFTFPDLPPPDFPDIGDVTSDVRILYLDVPALGRVRVARSSRATVAALAGVTMSIKLSADQSVTFMGITQTRPIEDGLSGFDLGLTFGGRVEFGRVVADGRYTFGMLNLAEEAGPGGETIKNRTLSFMAGWRF
jgi:hypothetical protein